MRTHLAGAMSCVLFVLGCGPGPRDLPQPRLRAELYSADPPDARLWLDYDDQEGCRTIGDVPASIDGVKLTLVERGQFVAACLPPLFCIGGCSHPSWTLDHLDLSAESTAPVIRIGEGTDAIEATVAGNLRPRTIRLVDPAPGGTVSIDGGTVTVALSEPTDEIDTGFPRELQFQPDGGSPGFPWWSQVEDTTVDGGSLTFRLSPDRVSPGVNDLIGGHIIALPEISSCTGAVKCTVQSHWWPNRDPPANAFQLNITP